MHQRPVRPHTCFARLLPLLSHLLQLLNMQSSNQFASHQLNRDTWRNDMVKSLVQNNFVFFQVSRFFC